MAKLKAGLVAAGLMLAGAQATFALDLTVQTAPNVLTVQPLPNLLAREGRLNELQILQSRQDRLNYQFQQQQYREQDRQAVVPMRPEVPVMKPSCQIQPFGNIFRTVCR
ncbi:hypothetical protein [Aminobacter sp. AP02]|uniref:hypothetical protein n=1 Tax=Aminobacter sp. AP02 TaxID=2135737 RepID=UPI0011B28100|nr:hypothetical protein [Aminobacter sp. AP02]